MLNHIRKNRDNCKNVQNKSNNFLYYIFNIKLNKTIEYWGFLIIEVVEKRLNNKTKKLYE